MLCHQTNYLFKLRHRRTIEEQDRRTYGIQTRYQTAPLGRYSSHNLLEFNGLDSLLARVYRVTARNDGNVSSHERFAAMGVYDLRCVNLEAVKIEGLDQLVLEG